MLALGQTSFSTRSIAGTAKLVLIALFAVGCAGSVNQQSLLPTLALSASAFNFQTVVIGQSVSQTLTISNTGTASLEISALSVSNTEFSISGSSVPRTILPSNSVTYTLAFAPTNAGSASGTLNITSNASSTPTSVSLAGSGETASGTQHSVQLSWNASSSQVIGYRVYRSETSGDSYNPLNGTAITALTYDDNAVSSGTTYYYVVTAVDASGNESVYSNQATAVVPSP